MLNQIKKLHKYLKNNSGRNNQGKITVAHKGSKTKCLYITLNKLIDNKSYKVLLIKRDSTRSAHIALIYTYINNKRFFYFIIAAEYLKKNDIIHKNKQNIKNVNTWHLGSCFSLKKLPIGIQIFNLEIYSNAGGKYTRSAGTKSQLIDKLITSNLGIVKLASGTIIKVSLDCTAFIGQVSNKNYKNIKLRKAGQSRWKGKRPTVRGVAMNPVDHPHGGGEGKSSGGRKALVSPWGKLTKGVKTRKKNANKKNIYLY